MMALALLAAVAAPAVGSLAVLIARPTGLRAGRFVTVGCGVGFALSGILFVLSDTSDDGLVGEVPGLLLRLDRAGAVLLCGVMFAALVVASFARRNLDLDARAPRFFTLLGLLVTGSALVVTPGGPAALVVGWVGSGWALVAMVGHRQLPDARRAQRRIARSLAIGDVALVLAVALTVGVAGARSTLDVAASLGELRSSTVLGMGAADVMAMLLLVAGLSRSALVPFHRWLVTTLVAPTPVSALVHAGVVSGAGLLFVRFWPVVLGSAVAVHLAFFLAVLSVLLATGAASTRVDVKGKLAWSTVAQMGFMVVQCTVGALSSAIFHIVGHGLYKATMFLGAGDAISAAARRRRRTAPERIAPWWTRVAAVALVPTAAVAFGLWAIPPEVSDGGRVLIATFAWLTVAQGLWGWLGRGPLSPVATLASGAAVALAATSAYFAGLRLVEAFVAPSFIGLGPAAGVGVTTLVITLAAAVVVGAAVALGRRRLDAVWKRVEVALARTAHPALAHSGNLRPGALRSSGPLGGPSAGRSVESKRIVVGSQIRADIARAASVAAPQWPLTSFVAVNPLGGLEPLGFEGATALARRQLRARTHLSLEEFRADHARGLTADADLRWAVESQFADACDLPPVDVGGREVPAAELIQLDLLHGPEAEEPLVPETALERAEGPNGAAGALIDAALFHSAARFVAGTGTAHPLGFLGCWRRDALGVSDLALLLGQPSRQWLAELGDDPADILAGSLEALGVADDRRVAEFQGHLGRLRGWAGYAKWRNEWAHDDEQRPLLASIDLVAARCALEAAVLLDRPTPAPTLAHQPENLLDRRTAAVLDALGASGPGEAHRAVGDVLTRVGTAERPAAWLSAQERNADRRLLAVLDRLDPAASVRRPEAQLAFCIDVRSEGFRRRLEDLGPYDTLGFAGFFGVAMTVQRLEWSDAEARCPVLVAPTVGAVERPHDDVERGDGGGRDPIDLLLTGDRVRGAASAAHAQTKSAPGAPFVMAETAGWIVGLVAAARTLLPVRPAPDHRPRTVMALDADVPADHLAYMAEALLTTMGLTSGFAPLVVLCGHRSDTRNNPHATSLDCGACAGASGQDNARAVTTLLNDPDVRKGLLDRGIEIPASTQFVAAVHETVGDRVQILDPEDVPVEHGPALDRLRSNLDQAGRLRSAERALDLPGRSSAVRRRGADWAQVRPEWGLARNASFIIGPRSMTAGLDLDGRSFLHNYEADTDPDGKVLETIMTAPLVVGHWISSQYYFSTVDPDAFGAGDKLVHNVVGDTGVVLGEGGDLGVGLPRQSTHCGEERYHQPVRLLAVVQAPLERIERIIQENPILTTLLGGSWMRLAGRSHAHERWSMRSPEGTWSAEPRTMTTNQRLERS